MGARKQIAPLRVCELRGLGSIFVLEADETLVVVMVVVVVVKMAKGSLADPNDN
jgi:hypothetical protein